MNPWPTKKLGEICEVLDSRRKPVTRRDRKSGPYPYYGATGIQGYVSSYIFDEDLILIGEDGARWGSGENTAFLATGKYWVNNHAHVIRPHRHNVVDNWLIYFLNYSDLSEYITGTTVKKLNQEKLRSIQIPLPPLEIQKKVVKKIEELFAKIAQAQSLREASIHDANNLISSELEQILHKASGWKELTINELAEEIQAGFACGKSNEVAEGIVHLRTHNIDLDGELNLDKVVKIPERLVNKSACGLRVGDIIFNNTNSTELVGKTIIIRKDLPYAYSNHLNRIRLKRSIVMPEWILYIFQKYWRDKYFEHICTRWVGQSGINQGILATITIPLPPITEQEKIVERMDALTQKVRELQMLQSQTASDLTALKQSILHQAFQGELIN